jgi:hypothetical protein
MKGWQKSIKNLFFYLLHLLKLAVLLQERCPFYWAERRRLVSGCGWVDVGEIL